MMKAIDNANPAFLTNEMIEMHCKEQHKKKMVMQKFVIRMLAVILVVGTVSSIAFGFFLIEMLPFWMNFWLFELGFVAMFFVTCGGKLFNFIKMQLKENDGWYFASFKCSCKVPYIKEIDKKEIGLYKRLKGKPLPKAGEFKCERCKDPYHIEKLWKKKLRRKKI